MKHFTSIFGKSVAVAYGHRNKEKAFVEDDEAFVLSPLKKGRPSKAYDKSKFEEAMRLYFLEHLSIRKVAAIMGLSHMSVYRMLSDPDVEILL